MPNLIRALKRLLCRHVGRRVWDISRLPSGAFRVRTYCPKCGAKWDTERAADNVARDLAGGNPEMLDTLRRNLGADDEAP